ncbi:D-inositol-3-phosphate glycosyltransferase [subsurface metagenome]
MRILERKQKLKILYLVQFFIPAWRFGGVVQLAYDIAKGMAQRGHEVTVFSTDAFEPGRRIEEKKNVIDGIEIFYFKNFNNYLASKFRIIQPKLLKKQLKKHIQDYDVIHLLDIYSISTYWAYKYSRIWSIPFFITTSGVLSYYSQKSKSLMKKVFNISLKKILQNAEAVVVQTESEKKDCEKFGLKNLNLIKTGINIKEYNDLPPRNIFRKKYNLKKNDVSILFLGRINEVKGIKYLIDAINKINSRKIYLFIVGARNNYLNRIFKSLKMKSQITITGWLSNEEKLEAYMGADIYCLPSIYDCAPISILEACACGLPIITTTSNGLFEIAKEGAGLVVEPRDSEALKNAILELIEDRERMIKLGKKARSIVQEEFDWDKKLRELEQLYYLSKGLKK